MSHCLYGVQIARCCSEPVQAALADRLTGSPADSTGMRLRLCRSGSIPHTQACLQFKTRFILLLSYSAHSVKKKIKNYLDALDPCELSGCVQPIVTSWFYLSERAYVHTFIQTGLLTIIGTHEAQVLNLEYVLKKCIKWNIWVFFYKELVCLKNDNFQQ